MAKFHDHLTSYWYSRVCQYVKGLLIKPLIMVKTRIITAPIVMRELCHFNILMKPGGQLQIIPNP